MAHEAGCGVHDEAAVRSNGLSPSHPVEDNTAMTDASSTEDSGPCPRPRGPARFDDRTESLKASAGYFRAGETKLEQMAGLARGDQLQVAPAATET